MEKRRQYRETQQGLERMRSADLALYNAGEQACAPGYTYAPRVRPYHLIHFVLSGCGRLHIDDRALELGGGDAFVIPANNIAWYEADHERPWHYLWIGFLGMQADRYLRQITRHLPETFAIRHLDIARYQEAIEPMLDREGDSSASSYFMGASVLNRIMSLLFGEVRHVDEDWNNQGIADEARFYLEMNFYKPLRIEDVARELNVSPSYLSRAFKELVGVTPKRYLMELKLERTAALLESTNLSVGIVASSVGFEDQLAFSKAFHKRFGISPSGFRAARRQTS